MVLVVEEFGCFVAEGSWEGGEKKEKERKGGKKKKKKKKEN